MFSFKGYWSYWAIFLSLFLLLSSSFGICSTQNPIDVSDSSPEGKPSSVLKPTDCVTDPRAIALVEESGEIASALVRGDNPDEVQKHWRNLENKVRGDLNNGMMAK